MISRRTPVDADLIRQAAAENWSLGELALRANVSLYVAEQRCREQGVVLRKVYKKRGGSHNLTGHKRHIPVISGVPIPPNGKLRTGRFNEILATTVRELDEEELARRKRLLEGARHGDPAAIQTLRMQYHLTLYGGTPCAQ